MIISASAIIANNGANGLRGEATFVREEFRQRDIRKIGVWFERLIQIIHVGRIVLPVMNLHRLTIEERLQGIGRVRKRLYLVAHIFRSCFTHAWI